MTILGIDLGTTNSALAIMEGEQPKILENNDGNRTTPSVVSFKNGEVLVGLQAKNQVALNPNTFVSIKSQMGKEGYTVEVEGKAYTPEEISSETLKYLKSVAEKYLQETVTEAVITVPAYFNDDQRTATKHAGEFAGLKVRRVVNEPTAAAIAYGHDHDMDDDVIMVYDLGGGTFDVSILKMDTDIGLYDVLSSNGDNKLGGDNFDDAIVEWANQKIKEQYDVDLNTLPTPQGMVNPQFRLKEEAEKAKKALSSSEEYTFTVPFLAMTANGPINLDVKLTRDEFNDLINDLVKLTRAPMEKALELAGLTFADIDIVLMNGGSTRVPMVQEFVASVTGKKPSFGVNPDEAVAVGAAIYGESLSEESSGSAAAIEITEVTSMAFGIEIIGDKFSPLIAQNASIPAAESGIYHTTEDNQTIISLKVYQGESDIASENYKLGETAITGIPPKPAGQAQVEISFVLNLDGILEVEAEDLATGKVTTLTINKNERGIAGN